MRKVKTAQDIAIQKNKAKTKLERDPLSLNYSLGKGNGKDSNGESNGACKTKHFYCENFSYVECLKEITKLKWEDKKNRKFVGATHISTGRNHNVRNSIVIDIDEKQYHYSTDKKTAEKEILKECLEKVGSKPFAITYAVKNGKIDKSVQIMFLIKETKHIKGYDHQHYLDVMRYFCSLFNADPQMTNWRCKNPFYKGVDIKDREQVGKIFNDSPELDISAFLPLSQTDVTPTKAKKDKAEKTAKEKLHWKVLIENILNSIVWENGKIIDGRKRYVYVQMAMDYFTDYFNTDGYMYCNDKFAIPLSKEEMYKITEAKRKFFLTKYKGKSGRDRRKSLDTRRLISVSKEMKITRLKKQGKTNGEIAKELKGTPLKMTKQHIGRLFKKIEEHNKKHPPSMVNVDYTISFD
ncbi:MAG: helix-turn-helix transcriptional regulator [Fibromonadales bacterium]|nr:helix-turn-helix transcriptional regulator [Fibromonadales bacterium]